ncbi:MAG: DUF5916 domain-containing protein [Longimicrobiales bacterium]
MLKLLIALQLVATPAGDPPAVYHGRMNRTTVNLPKRATAELRIDGALNEAQWREAALLTGFSQYQPVDGLAAEDSTEVLIWYTDHELYIGVRAFEPHGAVRATLADRDRIGGDDHIGFLLDTFNDRRLALTFFVNPLGVQGDGVMAETQRGTSEDLSPDYLFQSKGRVTEWGYEVELRIPFKTLRYPAQRVQDWGLHIVRRVQHSGQQQTWTPAQRGQASFLTQAGTLQGLTELKRGLVMDVNPVATTKYAGSRLEDGRYGYGNAEPELGLNLRWGVTTNLTMNASVNPDFSQVESDVGQINFDPRRLVFFPEKRPFFLENIQQFSTPSGLIYTRRIADPDGAAKFTGRVAGMDVGFLSALDSDELSRTGEERPLFNILRLRRNVGRQSSIGVVYTDRADGADYNRVAGVDGRLVFRSLYTLGFQAAGSFWRNPTDTVGVPLWSLSLDRSGRRLGLSSSINGIHEDFVAGSGFISRRGIVHSNINSRLTFYGTPEARVQAYTLGLVFDNTWDYHEFVDGIGPDDIKFHVKNDWALRGGWRFGADFLLETFRYPARFYGNYFVEVRNAQGVPVDTVPFRGRRRIPNYDLVLRFNSPQLPRFSANAFVVGGRDENFEEWAPGYIFIADAGATWRPTNQVRAELRYVEQRTIRPDDGSVVRLSRIPRLKVEYQIARPLFVRVVGQYAADERDELRDVEGSGDPILIRTGATTYTRGAFSSQSFRGDVLLSYQPSPGTVLFLGYGSNAVDSGPFAFRDISRTDDGFFLKLSYLLRL